MLFFTLDHVYAVEAPSIGDCCFTNWASGALSHSQTFFVGWSLFFLWALNFTPGADAEKNTDVGFRAEWPYRGTCRPFPFWIIPHRLSAKNGQRRMCWERFNEGSSTVLTCSRVWLWLRGRASVCVWERESPGGSAWAYARTSICTVCLYRRVNERGRSSVNTHSPVCVCVGLCACLCQSVRAFQYMSISFLSQSCYSTFIPLVGLYPVLLCLWI